MSYDFSLEAQPCEQCGAKARRVYAWAGMTVNVAPMWRRAGLDPNDMDGSLARDAAPKLRAAIHEMESEPEVYRQMNPANGWGDFDGLLPHMRMLLKAMEEHPMTIVRASN